MPTCCLSKSQRIYKKTVVWNKSRFVKYEETCGFYTIRGYPKLCYLMILDIWVFCLCKLFTCVKSFTTFSHTTPTLYASRVGSLMYGILYIRLDICYVVEVVNQYDSKPRWDHWVVMKQILKYLTRMRNYMLVYSSRDLILILIHWF